MRKGNKSLPRVKAELVTGLLNSLCMNGPTSNHIYLKYVRKVHAY